MKDNKSGWQFPKALEIIKCKEGNKEFMKERPARRPFGNTVLICEYPIDDTAEEEPNAKLITWRLAKRAARDFLRVSFMPSATGRITRGLRITSSTIGHRNRADTVGRRRAIFASRRRKRRRLYFGRIRKRKHRSRRRVTSWWKPARRSGATYIINMYANRRNRNAGRNANSGNARRGAIKSLVNA